MEISDIEKKELLLHIKNRYGYDFSNYSDASIKRRIVRFADIHKIENYFDLHHHLLNESSLFADFVLQVTVNVTEMFRDPTFFVNLKEKVLPNLFTYPYCRIWHAGCSTGEEVYSTAILLREENLNKVTFYATDINSEVISKAKEAIYDPKVMKDYSKNYIKAGRLHSLSDYYTTRYGMSVLNSSLKKNIVFSVHNLVSDSSFNEFNLIMCRNVLIYFNKELQERVIRLFYESLAPLGYLTLGPKESLQFSNFKHKFEIVDKEEKIYRKIV